MQPNYKAFHYLLGYQFQIIAKGALQYHKSKPTSKTLNRVLKKWFISYFIAAIIFQFSFCILIF